MTGAPLSVPWRPAPARRRPITEVDGAELVAAVDHRRPSSTGCWAAGWCRDRSPCIGGEPGIGKSTLLLSVAGGHGRRRGRRVLYVSGEESEPQVQARAPSGSAPSTRAVRSHRDRAARTCSPPSTRCGPTCWSSTRSRRWSTPTWARRPARSPRCASAPTGWCGWPRIAGVGRGAGRPRHQGRRAGRAARARARGRHRAVVRGRPPPRPAPAAGGQAPVRLHQRARAVRDDRRRAGRACPTPAGCSSPTAAPGSPARRSCPPSRATGRCWSRCRRWWRRRRRPPTPAGRPRASTMAAWPCCWRCSSAALGLPPRRGRRVRVGRGRRASHRAGGRPRRVLWPSRPRSPSGPLPDGPRGVRRGRPGRRAAPGRPDAAPAGRGGPARVRPGRGAGVGAQRRRRHRRRSGSPPSPTPSQRALGP